LDKHKKKARRGPTNEQLAKTSKALGHSKDSFYARSTKKPRRREASPDDRRANRDRDDRRTNRDRDDQRTERDRNDQRGDDGRTSKGRSSKTAPRTPVKDQRVKKRKGGRMWQISKLSPPSRGINEVGKKFYRIWIMSRNAYPTDNEHTEKVRRCFEMAIEQRPKDYNNCTLPFSSSDIF
jgi:hypothetical protein